MKAAALVGPKRIRLVDLPEPESIGLDEVLLEVKMVGVCGSDVHYFETGRIGDAVVQYPFILGHEMAGVVTQVGSAISNVRIGDLVAVDPAMACHDCDQCRTGRLNTCRNLRFLGCPGQAQGCLCQYVVMPSDCCYAVGEGLSLEQIVLTEPLAIAIYAVQLAGIHQGMDVAILGAGPIGLACLQVARASGARVCLVTDPLGYRMDVATSHGANWAGNPDGLGEAIRQYCPEGPSVVLEAAGQQVAIDQAIKVVRPGGKVVIIGIPRTERIGIDIHHARRKEVTLVNVRRQNACTNRAIEMIRNRMVDVEFMATHWFDIDRCQEAFELVSGYRDGVIKAMIRV